MQQADVVFGLLVEREIVTLCVAWDSGVGEYVNAEVCGEVLGPWCFFVD